MKNPFRRTFLVFLCLAGHYTLAFAQVPKINISPELDIDKNKSFQSHLYSDLSGHYLFFEDGFSRNGFNPNGSATRVFIDKYDPDFKLLFSKKYELEYNGVNSWGVRYFNGQFLWLFSETNKKQKYLRYNLMPIDLNGVKAKPLELIQQPYEIYDDKLIPNWNISKDSTKLLFTAIHDIDSRKLPFTVFISVLNKDLSVNWSRKISLTYTEKQVDVLGTILKNDGSVFMVAKVLKHKGGNEFVRPQDIKKLDDYEVRLFHYTKEDDQPIEYKIQLGDSKIRNAALETDQNDDLKCAGLYFEEKESNIRGLFFFSLNHNGQIQTNNKKPFTDAQLKQFGKRNTEKEFNGIYGLENSFDVTNFLIRPDGSAYIVIENNFGYRTTYSNGFSASFASSTEYYSRDIIVFDINSAGEIERTSILAKDQHTPKPNYFLSHVSLLDGNDLVFFYNEDKDNMAKPINTSKPKTISSFNDCVTVMTILTPDGKLNRSPLFEARDFESLFIPIKSTLFEGNKLFFTTSRRRLFSETVFRFGVVSLPNGKK